MASNKVYHRADPLPKEVRDLQIVVLDNPYNAIEYPLIQKFFAKTCALKVNGYRARFDYGVLPWGTTDLFGTNILICEKVDGNLEPICGYKSVALSKCREFNLPFCPLLAAKDNPSICNAVEEIIKSCDKRSIDISFDSSWTVSPDLRGRKEFKKHLRAMIISLTMGHHDEYNIAEWITSGTIRMGTHDYFKSMGLKEVGEDPVYQHPLLFNSDCMMFYLQEYSKLAFKMHERYRFLWDNRIELNAEEMKVKGSLSVKEKLVA